MVQRGAAWYPPLNRLAPAGLHHRAGAPTGMGLLPGRAGDGRGLLSALPPPLLGTCWAAFKGRNTHACTAPALLWHGPAGMLGAARHTPLRIGPEHARVWGSCQILAKQGSGVVPSPLAAQHLLGSPTWLEHPRVWESVGLQPGPGIMTGRHGGDSSPSPPPPGISLASSYCRSIRGCVAPARPGHGPGKV